MFHGRDYEESVLKYVVTIQAIPTDCAEYSENFLEFSAICGICG